MGDELVLNWWAVRDLDRLVRNIKYLSVIF